MGESKTANVKYVFMDIVDYTIGRSVEAQTEILEELNNSVVKAFENIKIGTEDNRIFLPMGDGVCVCLLCDPYDAHLTLALKIQELIEEYNEKAADKMRQFFVRIGINSNIDNLVTDINGMKNVAGAGVNMAQRIMSLADGKQILVGSTVYDLLKQRERYMNCFKSYAGFVKHGSRVLVHQFVEKGHKGVDISTPSAFIPKPEDKTLPRQVAYYFAHAIINRDYLLTLESYKGYEAKIALWYLAYDSVQDASSTETTRPVYRGKDMGRGIPEMIDRISVSPFYVRVDLADSIARENLVDFVKCFEGSDLGHCFINQVGIDKLRNEWRAICEEFSI